MGPVIHNSTYMLCLYAVLVCTLLLLMLVKLLVYAVRIDEVGLFDEVQFLLMNDEVQFLLLCLYAVESRWRLQI